jgi:hypothetical protein
MSPYTIAIPLLGLSRRQLTISCTLLDSISDITECLGKVTAHQPKSRIHNSATLTNFELVLYLQENHCLFSFANMAINWGWQKSASAGYTAVDIEPVHDANTGNRPKEERIVQKPPLCFYGLTFSIVLLLLIVIIRVAISDSLHGGVGHLRIDSPIPPCMYPKPS